MRSRPLCTSPSASQVKELTVRLKTDLAAVKQASRQGGRGTGGGGSAFGGTTGSGVVGGVAGNINVNLKDVKVPEFDVRVRRRSLAEESEAGTKPFFSVAVFVLFLFCFFVYVCVCVLSCFCVLLGSRGAP